MVYSMPKPINVDQLNFENTSLKMLCMNHDIFTSDTHRDTLTYVTRTDNEYGTIDHIRYKDNAFMFL